MHIIRIKGLLATSLFHLFPPFLPSTLLVQVNLSMDPEIGTIYSVAVPVRRVKPTMRASLMDDGSSMITTWDPADPDSSPADQFPYGT